LSIITKSSGKIKSSSSQEHYTGKKWTDS